MFTVIQSNKMEYLCEQLVNHLGERPTELHPLQAETVLVQSNGIAQWLKMALAKESGIAAGIEFPMPSSFVWRCYRQVLGNEQVPRLSPYDKAPLRWRLLRLLPELLQQSGSDYAVLNHWLSQASDAQQQRFRYDQLAQQLADLFDQYLNYRADWLLDWQQGGALGCQPQDRWQPILWRAIQQDVNQQYQQPQSHRAALHQQFIDHLNTADPTSLKASLPGRLSVFGISALSSDHLNVLLAISEHLPVTLFQLNPSGYYWGDLRDERSIMRQYVEQLRTKERLPGHWNSEDQHLYGNPLLASWGKQGGEYIDALYQLSEQNSQLRLDDHFEDWCEPFAAAEAPLLTQLQQLMLEMSEVPPRETLFDHGSPVQRRVFSLDDHSVDCVRAHSALREVEILHDQLLAAFEQDSNLKPRDLIVMVPAIERYAPLIEAVFGRISRQDPRYIPFTIADRQERASSPLLQSFEQLLSLPESRFTATQLLNLLDVAAIRRRFSLSQEDLLVLSQWIEESGIRWGLDEKQRASLGFSASRELNSWKAGLERMLLGYAVADGELWNEIAPYGEIGGLDAQLIGKLAEFVDQLAQLQDQLKQCHSVAGWAQRVSEMSDHFYLAETEDEIRILQRLSDATEQWQQAASEGYAEGELPCSVVAAALLQEIDMGGLSQRFLAGSINFCTLMPMRAIPFKRVCLLGMNDGEYPRIRQPQDFDLMRRAENYRPGDRSRREDDRYLLLEALLSARDKLYISWIGKDERDNSEREPSVLVGELLDLIDQGWQLEGEGAVSQQITVDHPLQPFSPNYFNGGSLFSYSHEWLPRASSTLAVESFQLAEPALPAESVTVTELVGLLRDPNSQLLRQLEVSFGNLTEEPEDDEHFSLNALEYYQLVDRLIQQSLQHPDTPVEQLVHRLEREGRLPLAGFAELYGEALQVRLENILSESEKLLQDAEYHAAPSLPRLSYSVELPQGVFKIEDQPLAQWHLDDRKLMVEYRPNDCWDKSQRTYKGHYFIRLWVFHLLHSARGESVEAWLITPNQSHQIAPISQPQAVKQLTQLAELWLHCRTTPLPLHHKIGLHWCHGNRTFLQALDYPALGETFEEASIESARSSWSGYNLNLAGEPLMRRLFPSFEQFWSEQAAALNYRYYWPLYESITLKGGL